MYLCGAVLIKDKTKDIQQIIECEYKKINKKPSAISLKQVSYVFSTGLNGLAFHVANKYGHMFEGSSRKFKKDFYKSFGDFLLMESVQLPNTEAGYGFKKKYIEDAVNSYYAAAMELVAEDNKILDNVAYHKLNHHAKHSGEYKEVISRLVKKFGKETFKTGIQIYNYKSNVKGFQIDVKSNVPLNHVNVTIPVQKEPLCPNFDTCPYSSEPYDPEDFDGDDYDMDYYMAQQEKEEENGKDKGVMHYLIDPNFRYAVEDLLEIAKLYDKTGKNERIAAIEKVIMPILKDNGLETKSMKLFLSMYKKPKK